MEQRKGGRQRVSIVIPVHNESANIVPLVQELKRVEQEIAPACVFEIIFVDDSTDDTWQKIRALAQEGVSGIRMTRRFGHQAALEAGLMKARGDAVIVMDGDLQHPPALLPKMIEAWRNGFDVVATKRLSNEEAGFVKRVTSDFFYELFNALSEIRLERGATDFRLLSRRAVDLINNLPETQKFYRGLIAWLGLPTTYIEFHAPPRLHGESAYSMRRLLALAMRGITSLSATPMNQILNIGLALSGVGLATLLVLAVLALLGVWSNPSGMVAAFVLLNTGVVLTALGIHALYTVALYREVLRRPNYIVAEESGFGVPFKTKDLHLVAKT